WMIFIFYVVVGMGPFVLWGPLYRSQCERRMSLLRGIGLGFGYSLFVLIFYVTSWRAFVRILQHREDWFKTRRNAEFISEIAETEPGTASSPPARQLVTVMNGEF
ncbi:MAG TPA: hypothetical protein VN847_14505, partial [Streptosporangiaceae bacterium]|nr:hypothetical protein [Streptosporangiaceae bacterium]